MFSLSVPLWGRKFKSCWRLFFFAICFCFYLCSQSSRHLASLNVVEPSSVLVLHQKINRQTTDRIYFIDGLLGKGRKIYILIIPWLGSSSHLNPFYWLSLVLVHIPLFQSEAGHRNIKIRTEEGLYHVQTGRKSVSRTESKGKSRNR